MYPETDIPPIEMDAEYLSELKENLPETLDEKEERFEGMVGPEFASQIIRSSYISLFERAVEDYDVQPKLVANVITNRTTLVTWYQTNRSSQM